MAFKMNEIKGFFKEYRFLSNFHLSPVVYEGMIFPSVENAYQAAKTRNRKIREEFQNIEPKEAKKLGNKITLRLDWENIKVRVMRELTYRKYLSNTILLHLLFDTGTAYLEETNTWNDKFWGVCNGEGRNELGKILMEVRRNLSENCAY